MKIHFLHSLNWRSSISKIFLSLAMLFSGIFIIISGKEKVSSDKKIGVFLSFSHPKIEESLKSFKETIASEDKDIQIVVHNAENSVKEARKIARKLHTDPAIKGIFSLGTLATKIMSQIEQHKPIVYAGVPDGTLLNFYENTKIFHVEEKLDLEQICFAVQSVCGSDKTIVFLKDSTEAFPISLKSLLEPRLSQFGIHIIEQTFSPANLQSKIQQVVDKKPSAIFLPMNPYVTKQTASIFEKILPEKIPVITDDLSLISLGAYAAYSTNYSKSGKHGATLLLGILKNPDSLSVKKILSNPLPWITIFNEDIAKSFGIKFGRTERKPFRSVIFRESRDKKSS